MFNLDFSNKIVLVTGASRGIGKDIAQSFASLGAKVIGSATSQQGADEISAYLGDKGFGMVLDQLNSESFESFISELETKAGGSIDILVNNAGITRDGLFMRMKDNDWQDVINCNLNAVAKLTQLCMRPMIKKRNGRIINITSVIGEMGNPGQCNYGAAKAGIIGFSRCLALELASRNITVNCVAPGFIETDMTNKLNDMQKEEINKRIPCQRMGNVKDISHAVLFLASDGASYITGSTLDVNGGMYCA